MAHARFLQALCFNVNCIFGRADKRERFYSMQPTSPMSVSTQFSIEVFRFYANFRKVV